MHLRIPLGWIVLLATEPAFQALSVQPSRQEFEDRAAWARDHLTASQADAWPFSLVYDQRTAVPSRASWKAQRTASAAGSGRVDHTVTLADPATGLVVCCEFMEFVNHPAVEWVVRFENRAARETPILEAVQALDISLPEATSGPTLHCARGLILGIGWFGEGPWFVNPGNGQAKRQLHPGGFKPLSDALHQSCRKLLLWFEAERVCEGTAWDRAGHPYDPAPAGASGPKSGRRPGPPQSAALRGQGSESAARRPAARLRAAARDAGILIHY